MLNHAYSISPQPSHPLRGLGHLVRVTLTAGLLLAAGGGCDANSTRQASLAFSPARAQVQGVRLEPMVFFINQEADAGFQVFCDVHNAGSAGLVKVNAFLTCSEGDFKREQTFHLDADETRTFRFDYPEPTYMAANLQARIKVYPGR